MFLSRMLTKINIIITNQSKKKVVLAEYFKKSKETKNQKRYMMKGTRQINEGSHCFHRRYLSF